MKAEFGGGTGARPTSAVQGSGSSRVQTFAQEAEKVDVLNI